MINFRLYTANVGTAIHDLLQSDAYKMVYENNIDENVSFNTPHFNIKKIIVEPNSALYDVKDYILYSPQFQKYHCKVKYLFAQYQ